MNLFKRKPSSKALWLKIGFTVRTTQLENLRKKKYQDIQIEALEDAKSLRTADGSTISQEMLQNELPSNLTPAEIAMYTPEALAIRYSLRRDKKVSDSIKSLWDIKMHKDELGCIEEDQYVQLLVRITKSLVEDFDYNEAYAMAKKDWKQDNKGDDTMPYSVFYDSMFELADIWVETIQAQDYANFLDKIQSSICTKNRTGDYVLQSLQDIEYTISDDSDSDESEEQQQEGDSDDDEKDEKESAVLKMEKEYMGNKTENVKKTPKDCITSPSLLNSATINTKTAHKKSTPSSKTSNIVKGSKEKLGNGKNDKHGKIKITPDTGKRGKNTNSSKEKVQSNAVTSSLRSSSSIGMKSKAPITPKRSQMPSSCSDNCLPSENIAPGRILNENKVTKKSLANVNGGLSSANNDLSVIKEQKDIFPNVKCTDSITLHTDLVNNHVNAIKESLDPVSPDQIVNSSNHQQDVDTQTYANIVSELKYLNKVSDDAWRNCENSPIDKSLVELKKNVGNNSPNHQKDYTFLSSRNDDNMTNLSIFTKNTEKKTSRNDKVVDTPMTKYVLECLSHKLRSARHNNSVCVLQQQSEIIHGMKLKLPRIKKGKRFDDIVSSLTSSKDVDAEMENAENNPKYKLDIDRIDKGDQIETTTPLELQGPLDINGHPLYVISFENDWSRQVNVAATILPAHSGSATTKKKNKITVDVEPFRLAEKLNKDENNGTGLLPEIQSNHKQILSDAESSPNSSKQVTHGFLHDEKSAMLNYHTFEWNLNDKRSKTYLSKIQLLRKKQKLKKGKKVYSIDKDAEDTLSSYCLGLNMQEL